MRASIVVFMAITLAATSSWGANRLSLRTDSVDMPMMTFEDAMYLAQADDEEFDPFLQPTIDPELEAEAARYDQRYKMLRWHQGFALASLGLVTLQTIVGQILFSQSNAGFGRPVKSFDEPTLRTIHKAAAYTSFSTYTTAMILALTAPSGGEDVEDGGKCGAMCWHKALPWIHGTGMMVMPWLGLATAKLRSSANVNVTRDKALTATHLGLGYATFAALAGAYLVIVID